MSEALEVTIELNGAPHVIRRGATVAEVLGQLGIDSARGGVAVAVDESVVPRSHWSSQELAAGARVEVIRAVQGG